MRYSRIDRSTRTSLGAAKDKPGAKQPNSAFNDGRDGTTGAVASEGRKLFFGIRTLPSLLCALFYYFMPLPSRKVGAD
jgi:hypothetical protein